MIIKVLFNGFCVCLLCVAGCTSVQRPAPRKVPPAELSRITPPAGKSKALAVPFTNPRTNMTLRWGDCDPQPPNVWYRVYVTHEMTMHGMTLWMIYAEVTNAHSLAIPITTGQAFYTVVATNGDEESPKGSKECEVK